MEVLTFETREEWLEARRGKITGSRAKDVISTGGPTKDMMCAILDFNKVEYKKTMKKEELEALLTPDYRKLLLSKMPKKLGFYELIAERLGLPPDDEETPMDRGTRLEEEAVARFTKETGKKVDTSLVLWTRDDDNSIAVSPDGSVIDEEAAVETKCLGSARHIKAYIEQAIPDDYWFQVLQYFIVNDTLKKLYFCFYDPRIPSIEFFFIEVTREQVQGEVDAYLEYQRTELAQVRDIVNKLTF